MISFTPTSVRKRGDSTISVDEDGVLRLRVCTLSPRRAPTVPWIVMPVIPRRIIADVRM